MRALTLANDNNFGRIGIRRNEESPIEGIDTFFVFLKEELQTNVEMRKARLRALTQFY